MPACAGDVLYSYRVMCVNPSYPGASTLIADLGSVELFTIFTVPIWTQQIAKALDPVGARSMHFAWQP